MVGEAARIAGLTFGDDELETIAGKLNGDGSLIESYKGMRQEEVPNSLAPALVFNPLPTGFQLPTERRPMRRSVVEMPSPKTDEDLAFLPVTHLARLLESQAVTSVELTNLYLSRLKYYDPKLHCVVSLTEDLALEQARRADQEIAAGNYRGPLHGVPWGAKDLLAVRGYPTTWGASPYRQRTIDNDAAVYERLRDGGAVLVAKLSMGALAQDDRWFGGLTRNPWKLDQGSSGSSAGPGSATAAGLVGFSIGTETRGSIISPSRRCGVTGLRPTFGRVSRYGAMTLSWSMDKIGPMCRSAEDCALVLDAINGRDDRDASTFDVPFNWDATADVRRLRVGYLRSHFEDEIPDDPQNPELVQRRREAVRSHKNIWISGDPCHSGARHWGRWAGPLPNARRRTSSTAASACRPRMRRAGAASGPSSSCRMRSISSTDSRACRVSGEESMRAARSRWFRSQSERNNAASSCSTSCGVGS